MHVYHDLMQCIGLPQTGQRTDYTLDPADIEIDENEYTIPMEGNL